MKIKFKHIIRTTVILIVLLAAFLTIKRFYYKSSYPPLDKQRAALVNKPYVKPVRILDSTSIINDLRYLSSDTCQGREPGSDGHKKATERIVSRMREAGLDSFNNNIIDTFIGKYGLDTIGKNVVGWIKGTTYPEKYIVISAHYDHLGERDGKIYYGASDNASGTACLLAMANYFKQHPQPYSLIFAAFDREESRFEGSFGFVNGLPPTLHLSNIHLNLNIDMIARNDANEIFVCGIYHYPSLLYTVKEVQSKTNAKILMGHDRGSIHEDWTNQSDHIAFYQKKIPFLYVGVEDHADYHQPTDTFEKINLSTYIENCNMIASLLRIIKL